MARLVVLDSGPLWLACFRPGDPQGDRCRAWLAALEASGVDVVIPAIADYETRRKLLLLNATAKLRNLDDLRGWFSFVEITTEALDLAAEFWALVRRAGLPTADRKALDGDAIVAAQALTIGQPGDVVIVATTNVQHLNRFPGIDAREWATIV